MARISFLFLVLFSGVAHSTLLNHQCFVYMSVQELNSETGENKFARGTTSLFDVTKDEHENAF